MNKIEELKNSPFLLRGILKKDQLCFEVESLQERLKRKLLKVDYLHKIMFHITILVFECAQRRKNFLKSLRIDQIYLNKDEKYSNVFIFEEDQLISTQEQQPPQKLLFNMFQSLGFDLPYDYFQINNYAQEKLLNELYANIFEEKKKDRQIIITETKILQVLYNIEIQGDPAYYTSFSKVFHIKTPFYINSSAESIVVKWVKFKCEEERAYLKTEIKLLESLNNCDRIAKLYCYDNFADQQFFFMKNYDKTLEQINNEVGEKDLNWGDLMHLIKQMILALKELHSKGICHRDLKPQNIMFEYLGEDKQIQQLKCVLIDFNRSKMPAYLESQMREITYYEGTPQYQPPEGTQENYGPPYDIWQLGYIIQCMILRRKNREFSSQRDRPIEKNKYNLIFQEDKKEVMKKYPNLYSIIFKMMELNPSARPQELQEIEEFFEKLNKA
ncbi:unnamed protein product (macronuclear) [Paramecium tetraurelia]|uniref:Protein kinase domain-containing protein n=1 Tax=Paramecium tetraurelia TaxID=5888 RepID=A0DZW4_PARTE|nr:uncharacterized protein GSPATT00021749001 [Paramecium tetraurelia]CAK88581.1 unnamed protein product [Paramecium tetraurelia]|eukprot:XP_001455978.1 hypothetical protein (macronuclear) [Paramecium tetraurelia strain d4-2]